jgi:hypothetical protein
LKPVAFAALLTACAPTTSSTDSTAAPSDSGALPTDTVPTDTSDTTGPLPEGPGFVGRLVDEDGAPRAGEQVLACTMVFCLTVDSDLDGGFFVPLTDVPESLSVKTHEYWDEGIAPGLLPLFVPDDVTIDVGEIVCPRVEPGEPWGPVADDPQTFDAGDGLELTMRRADVALPFGTSFDAVGAGELPLDRVPSYDGLEAEQVLAVYALHPFGATSASPVGVSAPVDLPAGTPVYFRSIGILGEGLSAPAVGASDGSRATTGEGQGLTELTYVVVSTPLAP